MALDISRIEASLGRDVLQYLREPDPEVEGRLSSDLEYLLTGHWDSRDHGKARWFDGLVEAVFEARKQTRVVVRGLMYWGTLGRDSRQWVDVFSADLRAVACRHELASYTLRFGRKGMEERRVRYGEHRDLRKELTQPRDWERAFVFQKTEGGG